MILESIVTVVFGGLLVLMREQIKSFNMIAKSLEKLANNVAYCPMNRKNKKMIKGDE